MSEEPVKDAVAGVVGGRHFSDYRYLKKVLDTYRAIHGISMVVSGGAKGADEFAYRYAVETGITFICHPPLEADIREYGVIEAFKRRNERIAHACDVLFAFPDPDSKGTYHTIGLAKKLKRPVWIFKYWEHEKK